MTQDTNSIVEALSATSGGHAVFGTMNPSGRKSKPISIISLGEISPAEYSERCAQGAGGETQTLAKLRDSHHKAAQLFADGFSVPYISLHSGYAPATLYILKKDPAFKQLVAFYNSQKIEVYVDTHERLADLANDTIGELRERLNDEASGVKTAELIQIATMSLDRSGHGPTSTTRTLSATITPEDLLRMKEEADKDEKGVKIIEARQEEPSTKNERPQVDSGPGESLEAGSRAFSETEEVEGGKGQGNGIRTKSSPNTEKKTG